MSFEIATWFYSNYKGEDKKFPPFIQEILGNTNVTCPKQILNEDRLWIFINISSEIDNCEVKDNSIVFNTKDTQLQCSFSGHISPTKFIILRHGFSGEIKICLEGKGISLLDFDYSESDPDYDEQWKTINKALNWEELYKIVNTWILSHQVDPLQRIKHRAINLFLSLCTDIQFLLELWRCKDFNRARSNLEELRTEWSDSISPVYTLYRLWYMLVGDHLNWKEGDLPEMPQDVSLPKDNEGNERPLYEWLTRYFGENQVQRLEEWKILLTDTNLCQIIKGENKEKDKREVEFYAPYGNGIYLFVKMLTEKIKDPGQMTPEVIVDGIKHNQTLEEELNSFLKWLNDLNDTFESLIKQCQKKS